MFKVWCQLKIFLLAVLCFTGFSVGGGFDQSAFFGFRYGPNLSWGLMGNTPFVWGQWLPQLNGKIDYTWLEPVENLNYGDRLGSMPTYLKMVAALEVSPFYGGYKAGLGLRPFKTNPQFEIDFVYESYLYFKSNLEMVNADVEGGGRIADTWNADYITNNVWSDDAAAYDYAQLFDVSADLSYFFPHGSVLGINAHYIRSDVGTDFDGKSYDYKRNIPVFSRDFIIELASYGCIPFNDNWAIIFETTYFKTGYLRSDNTVKKESLSYGQIMLGPSLSWRDGFRNITMELGVWTRPKKRFYNGSLSQQFLIQLEYKGYFSFPFHRNF